MAYCRKLAYVPGLHKGEGKGEKEKVWKKMKRPASKRGSMILPTSKIWERGKGRNQSFAIHILDPYAEGASVFKYSCATTREAKKKKLKEKGRRTATSRRSPYLRFFCG